MIVYGPKPANCTIGGKATGLYKLQNIPVSVPPFLVIPAETFDPVRQFAPGNESSADQRSHKLLTFTLSPSDQAAIEKIIGGWGFPGQAVVVRSSIADEDGQHDAFPGLMDSFLNLTSLADMYDAVAKCAASAYSDRAMAYRKLKGLMPTPRPAVIIQQQITPTASGVLFTTFPDYPQEMAIHATLGFGEGLVGGTLDADEFYWLKQSGVPHRRVIVTKTQQMKAHDGKGLYLTAVDPDKQTMPCLTAAQSEALFQTGTMLEDAFGHPQDVEFVIANDQIVVVQSRPITQPIPEVMVYDNANIQESYCGVTTPLTYSFASRAYATVYRQTMQTLGLPQAVIQAQESVVTNLLGLVKGRIYYNINNWYRGLQLLPSFRQNKADMERMMGLEEPVDFVKDHEKTIRQKVAMVPRLVLNLSRLLWAFSRLNKRVPAFHARFTEHYHRFYQQSLPSLSRNALLTQKERLDTALLGNWTTPIVNDFYVMMTNGKAVRNLKRAGIAAPDEFLSRYLSGDKQIESTQPVRAMQQLAVQALRQPELRQLILALPHDLHQRIQTNFSDFYQGVSQFIDQYGDRTVGELKLETVTMRLAPLVFYQYLRNYLSADIPVELLTGSTTGLHTEAANELKGLLADRPALFRRQVGRTLTQLQQAIRYREALRLERTRLFGMYRALYLAMGEQLAKAGFLSSPKDVFYLTETEIIQAMSTTGLTDLETLVASRRAEFAGYETDEVPARVTIPSPPTSVQLLALQSDELHGTGCVPGINTGETIVITDPRDNLDVTGKIVCALRTDPGWAVLFPTCRAVLIEKGSSLSHSVILLRELGIPTIINIPGLTKTLQTGQTIRMNGSTGDINILTPADDRPDTV